MMKRLLGALAAIGLSGCAAITADPWGWLDDPEQQSWKEVTVNGYGREIRFSIPDRKKSGGDHVLVWPEFKEESHSITIDLTHESLSEPSLRLADITWDKYWGGFYKKGNYDFSLDVWVSYFPDDAVFLDLGVEQRIRRQYGFWEKRYADTSPNFSPSRERFFSQYWVKSFQNAHGLMWVVENQPQITADHEIYRIPISDHHELKFSFFVRDKRYEIKEDPEWQKRRWEMVKQIMNTVTIDPSPFPNEH